MEKQSSANFKSKASSGKKPREEPLNLTLSSTMNNAPTKPETTPPTSPPLSATVPAGPGPRTHAITGPWKAGDVLAIEHADRVTGVWRWAIVSVALPSDEHEAEGTEPPVPGAPIAPPPPTTPTHPSRRSLRVRAWEPIPRRDLSADERKEAARLEFECGALVEACAHQRAALDAAQLAQRQKQSAVETELTEVEDLVRELLPVLETARTKVAAISTAHLREIRSYRKPSAVVQRVLEPVQVLLGDSVKNVGSWQKVSAMMAAVDFISRVRDLEPLLLPSATVKQFVTYMNREFPVPGGDNATLATDEQSTLAAGAFQADIQSVYHASAAAGRLLEWVLAVREFLVRVPTGAKGALQRVSELRQQQLEGKATIERIDARLRDVAQRRASLDSAAAVIKLGTTAAVLVDQEASVIAEPLVLLRGERDTINNVWECQWRPVPDAKAFYLPSVTVIGRLRRAPTEGETPVEGADAAVDLSMFVLTPGMAAAVVALGDEDVPQQRALDIAPLSVATPPPPPLSFVPSGVVQQHSLATERSGATAPPQEPAKPEVSPTRRPNVSIPDDDAPFADAGTPPPEEAVSSAEWHASPTNGSDNSSPPPPPTTDAPNRSPVRTAAQPAPKTVLRATRSPQLSANQPRKQPTPRTSAPPVPSTRARPTSARTEPPRPSSATK